MLENAEEILEEIKDKDKKLNSLLGNLPGAFFSCLNEKEKTMIFMSDGAGNLTGFENDQLLYNRYNELINKSDRDRIWDIISDKISRGEEYQVIYRITTSDFKEKWVMEYGVGTHKIIEEDKDRGPYILEGYIFDISALVESGLISVNL
ncbi:MAG: PAS domain-containing protein [Candidatus Muiribacteriaceae bacterium]